jgi:hypothetical protein
VVAAYLWSDRAMNEEEKANALFARRAELSADEVLDSPLVSWPNHWLPVDCDAYFGALPWANDGPTVVRMLRELRARDGDHDGMVSLLLRRLTALGHSGDVALLAEMRRELADQRPNSDLQRWVDYALLASGDEEATRTIATSRHGTYETDATISASLIVDPRGTFERLAPCLETLLAPVSPESSDHRRTGTALLACLARDGLPAGANTDPSPHPRGWLAADERWVPLLLKLRLQLSYDPIEIDCAGKALGHVAGDVLARYRPPRKGKRPPKAELTPIGEIALVAARGVDRVSLSRNHGAFLVERDRLVLIDLRKPDESVSLALPATVEDVTRGSSPWERSGLLAFALRPDGGAVACASADGVVLLAPDGSAIARWTQDETDLPHALCWGRDTLFVAVVGDDHAVVALDCNDLAPLGRVSIGDRHAITDPAYFSARPHPSDDVGVFEIAAGQDGYWVKVVEREPKVRKRKHVLDRSSSWMWFCGYADGLVVTHQPKRLALRAWPDFKPGKKSNLGGDGAGGAVLRGESTPGAGERALITVAEITAGPDTFAVFALPSGKRVAEGVWPRGHDIVGAAGDVVVTQQSDRAAWFALR